MNEINDFLQIFSIARKVCVLTGAGISAESGVPTFRGGGGASVWNGMPLDQISSARMVNENLDELWAWFDYRRGLYKDCLPNAGHYALAQWADRFEDLTLMTQNIDGLHARAGSKGILELHGNVNRSCCLGCGKKFVMNPEDVPHSPEMCDECGERVRPDVVLFGEILPTDTFRQAEVKSLECEIFFVVGTSAVVYPAAGLAELARHNGACLVEINPEETQMTHICEFSFRGNSGEVLPMLTSLLEAGER